MREKKSIFSGYFVTDLNKEEIRSRREQCGSSIEGEENTNKKDEI